jgi:hypothetical protein
MWPRTASHALHRPRTNTPKGFCYQDALEHRQSERSKTICRRGDQTIPVDRFAAEERCLTTTILRSDARLVTDSPIWNVVMC